jgi:ethanolamine utilization protein EutS
MENKEKQVKQEKQRSIQEYVPGKQVTMAHLIANPARDLYKKLGLAVDDATNAIGIMTITPSEASIVAADAATKKSSCKIGFVDRFSGTLVIFGDVSAVRASLSGALALLGGKMGFAVAEITTS